ncbi:MAG: aminoglycoside phosphotransferase family protein [Candidatus Roizmanbacteria bacterium]
MSQKPNISQYDTSQLLHEQFGSQVSELSLLSGGNWSQAYTFVHNNKKYVLRWCNSSETFEKDESAYSFNSEAMPVPRIIYKGKKYETNFAVSDFAEGKFFDNLTSIEIGSALPALFKLFDSLRTADLSKSTGYGGWNRNNTGAYKTWKEYLLDVKSDNEKNLVHSWYQDLANSALGTKNFDEIYSKLALLVDQCPEVRELIHSDLLNYNLLVSNSKISAVIDWQCSLYGDSLYDIAWFTFYAPWHPQFESAQLCQKALEHFESVATHTLNIQTRLFCYQLHIGLGSIAYNTFKKDWKAVQDFSNYTLKISKNI